ncbi:MAG: hypothetical protein NC412_14125, partial [Roseburia sp.]|nr:hypothetical protein [Roseburia sp.]MCM1279873.1 hypothetical protein [Robinsoniella sp.]
PYAASVYPSLLEKAELLLKIIKSSQNQLKIPPIHVKIHLSDNGANKLLFIGVSYYEVLLRNEPFI